MSLSIGYLKVASVEHKQGESIVVLVEDDSETEYEGAKIEGSLKLKVSQEQLEHIEAWGGPLRPGAKLDISLL